MAGPMRNATKPHSRAGIGRKGVVRVLPLTCELPVPPLPNGRDWAPEERKLWRSIWKGPQANAYDDSFIAAVAAYVCHASAIYAGAASAWQAQEFRHLGQQLGLTPAGMSALGWVLEQVEE